MTLPSTHARALQAMRKKHGGPKRHELRCPCGDDALTRAIRRRFGCCRKDGCVILSVRGVWTTRTHNGIVAAGNTIEDFLKDYTRAAKAAQKEKV